MLAFPGVFRGALDCRASQINEEMKLAAARAIAGIVASDELQPDYIGPSVFNREVASAVAAAVTEAAYATGVAQHSAERMRPSLSTSEVASVAHNGQHWHP